MIEYVKDDLFSTSIKVIAHGCNAQGVMGSGVAKIIKANYYDAFLKYREIYEKEGLRLGRVIFATCGDKIIANAITQETYGKGGVYIDYGGIRTCMRVINQYLDHKELTELAIPKIGAGLGGGDWNLIEKIIKAELYGKDVKVYVL